MAYFKSARHLEPASACPHRTHQIVTVARPRVFGSPRMEMCESKELKAQADQAFRNQDFQMAIALYSQALVWAPSETLLSNRSAAYAAAGNFKAALEDAKSCEEMAPDWPKAVFRRGVALRGLKRYDMAISAFAQGQDQDAWRRFGFLVTVCLARGSVDCNAGRPRIPATRTGTRRSRKLRGCGSCNVAGANERSAKK